MLRPGTFALTALLAGLSAVGPLTTDMYLPSLPDIARLLGASSAQVQLTISAYLIGFAAGQIYSTAPCRPTGAAASRRRSERSRSTARRALPAPCQRRSRC